MARRRLVLTLELQEARPNWTKAFRETSFPLFFEQDEIQIDERKLEGSLSALISTLESWSKNEGIAFTYKSIEK